MSREMTNVQKLAKFVYRTKFEDLPSEVIRESKRLLLDSIGCALVSTLTDKGNSALDFARKSLGGKPEATTIGFGEKLSAMGAAFVNGELINSMDYNAIVPPGNPTPCLIPAPLAMAEITASSGKELITACALSHEITNRMGGALSYFRDIIDGKVSFGPISGMSSSVFGGTSGVGKIKRFDEVKLAYALGIAGNISPMQAMSAWHDEPIRTTTKYVLAGWMSQTALTAASLAEAGYTGGIGVLDGERSFWRFSGSTKWNPTALTDGLGRIWQFPEVTSYKPYPACRILHTAIDCLSFLMEKENLHASEIESVKAYMESNVEILRNVTRVETQIDTQFNVPFIFSLVGHRIKPGIQWEEKDVYTNKEILDFMKKVTYGVHPRYVQELGEDPRSRTARVEVVARGTTFVEERRYPKGSPSPDKSTYMTDEELIAKFRDNAVSVLPAVQIEETIEALMNMEKVADIRKVVKLLSR